MDQDCERRLIKTNILKKNLALKRDGLERFRAWLCWGPCLWMSSFRVHHLVKCRCYSGKTEGEGNSNSQLDQEIPRPTHRPEPSVGLTYDQCFRTTDASPQSFRRHRVIFRSSFGRACDSPHGGGETAEAPLGSVASPKVTLSFWREEGRMLRDW